MPRGRYAPSPSGYQHLGNARTALLAWVRAKVDGGTFVLRVEDLDAPRTVPEAVQGNLDELRWLGLDWDEGPDVGGPVEPYLQSQRFALYQAALDKLEHAGHVFNCYLSRKDLSEVASAPHDASAPYGVRERDHNEHIREQRAREGRQPALRLRVPDEAVVWMEPYMGAQSIQLAREVGDIVLQRADGTWSYQLAVAVDDAAMGIAEVVRGEDLLPSTAVQQWLLRLLGHEPPNYAHVPILRGPDGQRLAKRKGDLTLHALRAAGVAPARVIGLLAATLDGSTQPRECSAKAFLERFGNGAPLRNRPLSEHDLTWLFEEASPTPSLDTPDSAQ